MAGRTRLTSGGRSAVVWKRSTAGPAPPRNPRATEPTVEQLHEWRKQTKYLRYHLEMLRPIWPERLGELAGEADHMGELLGDDHDLAVLSQMLTDDPVVFGGEGDVEMLAALIDRRRVELEQEAIALGGRFFQEKSGEFTHRLKGYWKKCALSNDCASLPNRPRARADVT